MCFNVVHVLLVGGVPMEGNWYIRLQLVTTLKLHIVALHFKEQ